MLLDSELVRLETSELVRRLLEPEDAYLFKHALVQDTARSSLLLQERKRLHRLVGEALEGLYPAQRAELAPLLAQHFANAGDDARTLEYATLAGDLSARVNAHTEAVEHYTHALKAGERTNAPVLELFIKRGRVQELSGDFGAALATYAEMSRVAAARADRDMELAAMMASATIYSIPSTAYNAPHAQELNDRALELARELNDKAAQAKILWNLMLMNSRVGKGFKSALVYGEEALEIARENNLYERLAYVLNDLSPLLTYHGQSERGVQYNLEARAMWVELGNLPMLGGNYGYAVMNHLVAGDYGRAIEASRESLRISRGINNAWNEAFAQTWVGEAYLEFGEIEAAERVMLAAIALGERVFPPTLVVTRSDLARLYADFGQPLRGIELGKRALQVADQRFQPMRPAVVGALGYAYLEAGRLEDARDLLRDVPELEHYGNNPMFAVEESRTQIELMLRDRNFSQALSESEGLLEFLRRNNIHQFEPDAQRLYAGALSGLGEFDMAVESLQKARTMAEAQKARWSLWQILAAMSRVQAARGDQVAAEKAHNQAREIIEYIAARTPPDLRPTFLERTRRERSP